MIKKKLRFLKGTILSGLAFFGLESQIYILICVQTDLEHVMRTVPVYKETNTIGIHSNVTWRLPIVAFTVSGFTFLSLTWTQFFVWVFSSDNMFLL